VLSTLQGYRCCAKNRAGAFRPACNCHIRSFRHFWSRIGSFFFFLQRRQIRICMCARYEEDHSGCSSGEVSRGAKSNGGRPLTSRVPIAGCASNLGQCSGPALELGLVFGAANRHDGARHTFILPCRARATTGTIPSTTPILTCPGSFHPNHACLVRASACFTGILSIRATLPSSAPSSRAFATRGLFHRWTFSY
jgi:hypothetical protein